MKRMRFGKKAANSFVGRMLRRLLGEEKGTVMMEYAVVGLLVLCVVVVIIGALGGSLQKIYGAIGHALWGQPDDAVTEIDEGKDWYQGVQDQSDDVMKQHILKDPKYNP